MTEPWRNRIVAHGTEAPDQLLANPRNWRIHPKAQQDALGEVLDRVGWVQDVVVNRRTGHVVDGHLRVSLSISREEAEVPVVYVDLDEEEEALILASLDPLAGMAVKDEDLFRELVGDLELDGALAELLAAREAEANTEAISMSDRFLVPPFSVLNAREGWWQERKRAWVALGIQSELGRGESASIGGAPIPLDRTAPGGSKRPAANYSKTKARGDGRGRAVNG